ncbi:ABC transporter ATP-binding protein [uncultured Desulfuromonas sp.]|uniref:ABC transporter ATP-binding protein n=1 Tax=uncultured Desulfuromonas sp. TaxID=181013 RepID=UPI002AAB7082|nr:ABC transporter ATP-binding protein [uncultured Desulfuromonas sp.]
MVIEARNLRFSYGRKPVLQGVDFNLAAGEVVSLLGPNGSGKSTLLKILLGLLRGQGEVTLFGKPIGDYRRQDLARKIAYVPQIHHMPFSYTVLDVVLMGRLAHGSLFSNYCKRDYRLAHEALEQVGAEALAAMPFSRISGGQQQLALIARALCQQAEILFLDEPVNGLDYGNQIKLLRFLRDFAKRGTTFLKTTHYPDHALACSDRVAMLDHGEIFAFDQVDRVLTPDNVQRLYGVAVEIAESRYGYRCCMPQI